MDFKLRDGEKVRTRIMKKASDTVIEAGDIVALTNGLIVKAVAASAAIAFCPAGAPAGETEIEVTTGNDFTLIGLNAADAVFAVAQGGDLCDLKGTTTQIIDNDTSSTNVFVISPAKDAGVVGSALNIEVRINKPLF